MLASLIAHMHMGSVGTGRMRLGDSVNNLILRHRQGWMIGLCPPGTIGRDHQDIRIAPREIGHISAAGLP
jgi:hypothetical protein